MPIGLYGKLPSHGDFLQRGVADSFVNVWDAWLQAGLSSSRRALGNAWLDLFLTCPVWRFAFAGGVIGAPAWAGILLPSVDSAGRYFPLTIVAELAPSTRPFELAVMGNGWFDWSEAAARRALEHEVLDLEQLDAQLRDSAALLNTERLLGTALQLPAMTDAAAPLWRGALPPDGDMGQFFALLASVSVGTARDPLALWWSAGSPQLRPTVLMTRGLPDAKMFHELLGSVPDAAAAWADTIVRPQGVFASVAQRYRSAAISDIGRWREENQDAFLERGAEGLWLVADGMGGHKGGALASQLVVERARLADLSGDVSSMARAVVETLRGANAELRRRAAAEAGFDAGTTVVALCLRDQSGKVLWVGDSRLYRWRAGELVQLTRDHSVGTESGLGDRDPDSYIVTRAVGGSDVLEIDETQFEVQAGDRFLLCTDGLYADLTLEEISAGMAAEDCAAAVARLTSLALERGGRDNATGVQVAVLPLAADATYVGAQGYA